MSGLHDYIESALPTEPTSQLHLESSNGVDYNCVVMNE